MVNQVLGAYWAMTTRIIHPSSPRGEKHLHNPVCRQLLVHKPPCQALSLFGLKDTS